MPINPPDKTADLVPLISQANLVGAETFLVPTAFAPGADGRSMALASCTQALVAMTEFHLAAACEEIFDWLTANGDVTALTLSGDFESDDEGRSWRAEHFCAEFKDGTNSKNIYFYKNENENRQELSDSPENLCMDAENFFYSLLDQYPLARATLMNKTLTVQSSNALIPSAFKARQEALAISSATPLAPNSTRVHSI